MNDTNLIALLIEMARNRSPVTSDHTAIWIAALSPIFAAIVLFIQSWSKTQASRAATDELKKTTSTTAETVEKVHIAVNSGATAALEKAKTDREAWDLKLSELTAEITRLASELAAAKEGKHQAEIAKALITVPLPFPGPTMLTPEQLAQIKQAMTETK